MNPTWFWPTQLINQILFLELKVLSYLPPYNFTSSGVVQFLVPIQFAYQIIYHWLTIPYARLRQSTKEFFFFYIWETGGKKNTPKSIQ